MTEKLVTIFALTAAAIALGFALRRAEVGRKFAAATEARDFPEDWVTLGWSRGPGGRWMEIGFSPQIGMIPPAPEIGLHDVAELLNKLGSRAGLPQEANA